MDLDFDEWAINNGLKVETLKILKKEDLDTKEVLLLMDDDDIKDIKLTVGQNVLLRNLIRKLRSCNNYNKSAMLCYRCKYPSLDSTIGSVSSLSLTQSLCDSDERASSLGYYDLPCKTIKPYDTQLSNNLKEWKRDEGFASSLSSRQAEKENNKRIDNIWQQMCHDMRDDMEKMLGIVHSVSFEGSNGFINCKCCNDTISIASVSQGIINFKAHINSQKHRDRRAMYFEPELPSDLVAQAVLEILLSDFSNTL